MTATSPEKRLYICLSVQDLARSIRFFRALGFPLHPRLTDHSSACLIVNGAAHIILLARPSGNARASLTGAIAFSCASRREVDRIRAAALAAGAQVDKPTLDLRRLYSAPFKDLDGYPWEAVWTASTLWKDKGISYA